MSVRIKELAQPNLTKVKMNCDNILHEKLLDWPAIKDCFSTNHFTVVCGKMGQGKTSLATSLIKNVFKKVYENIYVIMPEASRRSIENDIFGKNLPEDQLFSDLNVSMLEGLYETLNANSENGENSLILLDDFQAIYKNRDIAMGLERIIIKLRHLRCTIILLCQNFQKLPKPLRELAFNIVLFNVGKSQLEKVFEEVITTKRHIYDDIIKLAFQDPHDFLLINLHRSRKIYRGFDEIVIPDGSEADEKHIEKNSK